MNTQRSLSQGIRIRSRSSQNLKRSPSLLSIKQSSQPNQLLNKAYQIIESKKEISIIAHFQRYKAYVLDKAREFKKYTSFMNQAVLMMLINSRHFNLGLQQMLIKLFKLNRVSLSLDNFDPRSFVKVQSWMITFVKRYLQIDNINKKIEMKHKNIENQFSAYFSKVFDKRFQSWLKVEDK